MLMSRLNSNVKLNPFDVTMGANLTAITFILSLIATISSFVSLALTYLNKMNCLNE